MEDQTHSNPTTTTTTTTTLSSSTAATAPATEPVRSRWTPKPEQILILESIFNSGMVNPPKDETVRIRKLLEQYGPVGDANVFYWFQNRRSRSRRRQRQLQAASLQLQPQPVPPTAPAGGGPVFEYGAGASSSSASASAPLLLGFQNNNNSSSTNSNNNNIIMSGRTSTAASFQVGAANASPEYEFKDDSGGGGLSLSAAHLGFLPPQDNPNCFPFHLPPGGGFITVFVNGVATQVPAGSFDVKAMFGEEGVLVHSTGVPVPINEFGITLHSLHHGDTYFLVPRLA